MKRLLSLLLAVAMVVSLVPMSASAASNDTLSVEVKSEVVRYDGAEHGMDVTVTNEVTGTDVTSEVDTVKFVAGLDINDVNIDTEGKLVGFNTELQLHVSEKMANVIEAAEQYSADLTVGTLVDILQDAYTLENLVKDYNVSEETAKVLAGALISLPEEVDALGISVNPAYPTNTGAYLVGAVTADADYADTAMGLGVLAITPDGNNTEIEWVFEDVNNNGFFTVDTLSKVDLSATAVSVAEPDGTVEEAEVQIAELFIGTDINGNLVITRNQEDLTYGVYTEIAMVVNNGNTMYYSNVLVRTFTVVEHSLMEVKFNDDNNAYVVVYGETREITAEAVDHPNAEVNLTYYGTTATGELYKSADMPTELGAYTVVATAVDGNVVGMNVAALAIVPAEADFAVVNDSVNYTGEAYDIIATNEAGLDYVAVVVNGNDVNVVVPAVEESISIYVPVKIVEAVAAVELIWAELPEEITANEDAQTIKAKLVDALTGIEIENISLNGELPTAVGVYEITAIGYGQKYQPVYSEGTLEILSVGTGFEVADGEVPYKDAEYEIIKSNEDGLDYIAVVVSEDNVNVVVSAVDELNIPESLLGYLDASTIKKAIETVWNNLPTEIKENAEAAEFMNEILAVLDNVGDKKVTLNGKLPKELGTYEIAAVGYKIGYTPAADKGTLTIVKDECTEDGYHAFYCESCDKFTDVEGCERFYHLPLDFFLDMGIVEGMTPTTFGAHTKLTRGMLVTYLYRMAGEPSVEGLTTPFTDVEEGRYFTDPITWAYNEGIVKGMTETTFEPMRDITRQELATMLYREAGEPDVDVAQLDGYPDGTEIHNYAKEAMSWATATDVVEGMENVETGVVSLAARQTATRGQSITMLYRYVNL